MWNCDTSNAIKKQKTNNKQTPLWFSIILFHNTHKDMKTQSGFHVVCWRESLNQVYYHHFSITRTMSGYVSSVSVIFLFHEVMIAKTPITDQHFTILLCLKEKKRNTPWSQQNLFYYQVVEAFLPSYKISRVNLFKANRSRPCSLPVLATKVDLYLIWWTLRVVDRW